MIEIKVLINSRLLYLIKSFYFFLLLGNIINYSLSLWQVMTNNIQELIDFIFSNWFTLILCNFLNFKSLSNHGYCTFGA